MVHKQTIENCQAKAEELGGECLEIEYKNSTIKMNWICGKGHKFKKRFEQVKRGKWCTHSDCKTQEKRKLLNIDDCHEFAKTIGWICLEKVYDNNYTDMKWQCNKGHIQIKTFHNLKDTGVGCNKCTGYEQITIEDCHRVAAILGIKCLSEKCDGSKDGSVRWQCRINSTHEWPASYDNVWNNKRSCPECNITDGENRIILYLNKYKMKYKREKKFPGLVYKKQLKLDFYSKKNWCIEMDGEQHFNAVNLFDKGTDKNCGTFQTRRVRDIIKMQYLMDKKMDILRIPYTKYRHIERYLARFFEVINKPHEIPIIMLCDDPNLYTDLLKEVKYNEKDFVFL